MVTPEVSVCVPAYQADRYLADAIRSVVEQTFQEWELIIVDNASDDRTAEVARSFDDRRISVYRNDTTIGLAANWNRAVSLARGHLVKVLPADDYLMPNCLGAQVKMLQAFPHLALVAARRDFIDAEGRLIVANRGLTGLVGDHAAEDVVRRVVRSGINPIGDPATLMFRRHDFLSAGSFDASLPFPMDLELAVRLLRRGGFHGIEESLAVFRIRGDSYTASSLRAQGHEHRTLLRRIATDPRWAIGRPMLLRGLAMTRTASLKRRLLYAAALHRWSPVRRLPAKVLDGPDPTAA